MSNDAVIQIHKKVWGEEHWIVNEQYCGKKLLVKEGSQSSMHFHKEKIETFYLLTGEILLEVDDRIVFLTPGKKIDIPAGVKHRFTGIKDSELIEFSTHHAEEDTHRITQSQILHKDAFDRVFSRNYTRRTNNP